ncbi:hypothetical protein FTX61_16680 [Nitriliruptoraceae bacterium ZYF776]|nr:hypothetical protein [Profundirhabdus halotolerans]
MAPQVRHERRAATGGRALVTGAVLVLALAGCGGGGADRPPDTTDGAGTGAAPTDDGEGPEDDVTGELAGPLTFELEGPAVPAGYQELTVQPDGTATAKTGVDDPVPFELDDEQWRELTIAVAAADLTAELPELTVDDHDDDIYAFTYDGHEVEVGALHAPEDLRALAEVGRELLAAGSAGTA